VALVLAATLGCGERHRATHGVWTLYDIRQAHEENRNIAAGATLPDGIPTTEILQPEDDGTFTLRVQPCFAEASPAAYVTTDVWVNYDAVWLQPLFVPFVDDTRAVRYSDGRRAPAIVDVGPESAFYSPFWLVAWAIVGDVDPERYRTPLELFDAGIRMVWVYAGTAPLKPVDVVSTRPGGVHVTDPTYGMELDDIPTRETWFADEHEVSKLEMFDFGRNLITVTDHGRGGVVEATPLFMFVTRSAGAPQPVAGAYKVAGVGPVGSGRVADVGIDAATGRPQPHFGGLWRMVLAYVPGTAGAFHVDQHPASAAVVTAAGNDPRDYEGRVAADAACFEQPALFPASCRWLDSQAKIEATLGGSALVATEITASGPLVFYGKQPVKR